MKTRSLILLRGLPGSGKTTLASVLSEGGKYPVFSIDDYFTDKKGSYHFVHTENHLAYHQCEQRTMEAMKAGVEKIFVANTFTIDWELEPYFKMASELNYTLFVVTVENYHGSGNVHMIPDEQIRKMAEKFKTKLH